MTPDTLEQEQRYEVTGDWASQLWEDIDTHIRAEISRQLEALFEKLKIALLDTQQ